MTYSTRKSKLGRALAVVVSAALLGGLSLVGAAPAVAAGPPYSVSGVVQAADGAGFAPLADVTAKIVIPDPGYSDTVLTVDSNDAGEFAIGDLGDGSYTVTFNRAGYSEATTDITIAGADLVLEDPITMILLPEELAAGTAAIAGVPVVGNVLTAVTDGWPAGTTLTYQWFYSCGQCGGAIDGETSATYTVTESLVSYWIGVSVTGTKAGFSNVSVNALQEIQASAPQKAPAPAPTDLAAYLQANGSTPEPQTSTGLPAGALDASKAHTANVQWFSPDSFVDVYAFSVPVFVGTFPVVNGVAQITLSTAVLGQLAAGNHTLVITGQSSGAVQSVALAVGLPVTGSDPTVPVTVASLLTLLGAGLMFIRRRVRAL